MIILLIYNIAHAHLQDVVISHPAAGLAVPHPGDREHIEYIICHISHFTFDMSHVLCHISDQCMWNAKVYVNMLIKFEAIYGRNQSVCEKAKSLEFLPPILWVFLTIYIFYALMKIIMCFKHLEASHTMSCDSWY